MEERIQEAKTKRRSSKAKFTRKFNEIGRAIDEQKSQEVVSQLFAELKEAWQNVEAKHDDYCTYLVVEECEDEENWIAEIHQRYVSAVDKNSEYERYLKEKNDVSKRQEQQREVYDKKQVDTKQLVEKTRVKRSVAYYLFQQQLNDIKSLMKDESTIEIDVMPKLSKILDSTFKDCKELNDKHLEALIDEELNVAVEISWMTNLQKQHNDAICEIEKRIAKGKESKVERSSVRLEKTKLPTFNGNLRDYARFKSDFKKQVQPYLSKDSAPYTLKSWKNNRREKRSFKGKDPLLVLLKTWTFYKRLQKKKVMLRKWMCIESSQNYR